MSVIANIGALPEDISGGWPGEGQPWVTESRVKAPGLDELLLWVLDNSASRVAFRTGRPVVIRRYGKNYFVTKRSLNESEISEIINHVYSSDGSGTLLKGDAIDHAYTVTRSRGVKIRFRIHANAVRTSGRSGADIILRPFPLIPPTLDEQRVEAGIREAFTPKDGFVAIAGATGSGKSTLQAGFTVYKLKDPEGNYNIIEGAAPVEYLFDQFDSPCSTISQLEIPRDVHSFDEFIAGAVRSEPTDIIVGECRDTATMAACVQAAITGHVVNSTLHAQDNAAVMQRIPGLCPEGERANILVAVIQTFRLLVNQRLVPSVDGRRVAIREFLPFDHRLRNKFLMASPEDWPELTRVATENDGQSYAQSVRKNLDEGLIEESVANDLLRGLGHVA